MRRIVSTLSGLAAVATTLILTVPVASAFVAPPSDGGATEPAAVTVHHHTGPLGWQIGLLFAVAAMLIAVTGVLVARRVRTRSHRPAIS